MSEHATRDEQERRTPSRRGQHRPSLSVVVLSQGDRSDLERALATIAGCCRRMEAEIVVVRSGRLEDTASLSDGYPCVTFLAAQPTDNAIGMRDVGMRYACGDIVVLRADNAVGDGVWLEALCNTVGTVEDGLQLETEIPIIAMVEDGQGPHERRRARAYATPSTSTTSKRRADAGRIGAGTLATDVGAPARNAEM